MHLRGNGGLSVWLDSVQVKLEDMYLELESIFNEG